MKTNKVVSLIIAGLMLMPSTMVYAKGNEQAHGRSEHSQQQVTQVQTTQSTSPTTEYGKGKSQEQDAGTTEKEQAQTNKDNKKQEIAAFKSQIKSLHTQLKALRQQIIPLQQQVGQKKDQLAAILQQLQSGEKTLPADMLNTLINESQNLLSDGTDLKSTSGVTSDASSTQSNLNNGDFNNAVTSLNKVIAKLQARLSSLNKLNADLDAMLAIANQATTPAPVDSTQPTTSTGDNSSTTTTQPTDNTTTSTSGN